MVLKQKHTVCTVTYYVRAVPSVNQDLVVGVSLPLDLLGAVGSWRLRFAGGRKGERLKDLSYTSLTHKTRHQACLVQSAARDGGLPFRHGRGDVSVIESGMPGKQDDASVTKHAVEKQLRRAQQQQENIG